MVELTKKRFPKRKIMYGNLFKLPFKKNTFNCVVNLRIFHHYPKQKINKIITESVRVLKKKGVLLFDTYTFSPKIILNYLAPNSPHRVYLHKNKQIYNLLLRKELTNIRFEKAFLFPPLIYRYLPLRIIKFLYNIEKCWPQWLLVKTFWRAEKP